MLPTFSFARLFAANVPRIAAGTVCRTRLPLDERAAQDLVEAAQQMGFVYLSDTGAAPAIQRVFTSTERMFGVDGAHAVRELCQTANAKRGAYRYVGAGGGEDLIEAFHIGNDDAPADALRGAFFGDGVNVLRSTHNRWPKGPDWAGVRPALRDAFEWNSYIAIALLQGFALGLGDDQLAYCMRHEKLDHELEIKHYSQFLSNEAPGRGERIAQHKDLSSVTLLSQTIADGALQVWNRMTGSWVPVPAAPSSDSVLVNTGVFLELATQGRILATPHRVAAPSPGHTGERVSMTFFAIPDWDARVPDPDGCESSIQVGELMPFEG